MANRVEEELREFSDPNDISSQIREYIKIKATMTSMESRSKELRDILMAQIDSEGYEDNNGNLQLDFESPIDGVVRLEKQRRTSRSLNEDIAMEILEAKGLVDDLTKLVRVVDEEAVMAALYEDKLTEEELDSMFPTVVTWALRTPKK
jgi:hypothetical protein